MKQHDLSVIVSESAKTFKVFDATGKQLWHCEAHCYGWAGHDSSKTGGDTPLGRYRCDNVVVTDKSEPVATWQAYGFYYTFLAELDGQESKVGRSGIGLHGGGTGLADPLAPRQGWTPTSGCIRLQNEDNQHFVKAFLEPAHRAGGEVIISVER